MSESLFARRLGLSWYRGHEKFGNGITWVRVGNSGPGLWWRDSRIAKASWRDIDGLLLPLGPYRVRLLGWSLQGRKYVESLEYPEMTSGPPGRWLTCGACGWDGPMRDASHEARRDRWRHLDFLCWLRSRWVDSWLGWRLTRGR